MRSGFLRVPSGFSVYFVYDEKAPAEQTLLFLNGLSDETSSWQTVVSALDYRGNILRVDLIGQGRALQRDFESGLERSYDIAIEEQSAALALILNHLKIPRLAGLVGFSYGGGVALDFAARWPQMVERLFLWLPYVIRLDLAYPAQRAWLRYFESLRALPGLTGPMIDACERVYQNFLHHYMHHRFHQRIPDRRIREVAVQLSEGIMRFDGFACLSSLPSGSVHLLTVERDSLVPVSLYRELWQKIPDRIKKTWLRVEDGEHLLIEQAPLFLAKWLGFLLTRDSLGAPKVYTALAHAMEIYDDRLRELREFFPQG